MGSPTASQGAGSTDRQRWVWRGIACSGSLLWARRLGGEKVGFRRTNVGDMAGIELVAGQQSVLMAKESKEEGAKEGCMGARDEMDEETYPFRGAE